jgi:uncharacterized protein YdiU (UPF0061 family)
MKTTPITTAAEMVAWANKVNMGPQKDICDLQDVFGRSVYNDLVRIYTEDLGANRPLVTFSINKCMGADCFENFVREWISFRVTKERTKLWDEIQKENETERQAIHDKRYELDKKEVDYKNTIARLEIRLEHETKERAHLLQMVADAQDVKDKADKYDALKAILSS